MQPTAQQKWEYSEKTIALNWKEPRLGAKVVVAARGLEPRRLAAQDPKSCVSANFTKRPECGTDLQGQRFYKFNQFAVFLLSPYFRRNQ